MNQKYKLHPPIPTVNYFDESSYLDKEDLEKEEKEKLKPMDMCYSSHHPHIAIGIVLMGPFSIPYFHDGSASDYAYQPLDIQDPEEWVASFSAYIVYDLNDQKHKICPAGAIKKMEESQYEGHIPFDYATAKLRCNLGLIELANKWWKKE